jgi:hypothetical protein
MGAEPGVRTPTSDGASSEGLAGGAGSVGARLPHTLASCGWNLLSSGTKNTSSISWRTRIGTSPAGLLRGVLTSGAGVRFSPPGPAAAHTAGRRRACSGLNTPPWPKATAAETGFRGGGGRMAITAGGRAGRLSRGAVAAWRGGELCELPRPRPAPPASPRGQTCVCLFRAYILQFITQVTPFWRR